MKTYINKMENSNCKCAVSQIDPIVKYGSLVIIAMSIISICLLLLSTVFTPLEI